MKDTFKIGSIFIDFRKWYKPKGEKRQHSCWSLQDELWDDVEYDRIPLIYTILNWNNVWNRYLPHFTFIFGIVVGFLLKYFLF